MQTEDHRYLSTKQAVEYLGLSSRASLYSLNTRKQLPFIRLGRRVLYDRLKLDEFLATRGIAVTAEMLEPKAQ